ncbi:MAG: queuosine precursor transporter [Candidatus Saccharimonadales bacterium]
MFDRKDLRDFAFIFSACLSVVLLIVSNIAATKLWDFFGIAVLDGGILSFPFAFVLSDMILEIWGKKKAKYIIWCGFILNLLAMGFLGLVQVLPAGEGWENQAAYEVILGFLPRVVLGSMVSYIVAQLLNVAVFVKIRNITGKKWLWARSLGSSVVANIANSLAFCGIVFGGVIDAGAWWGMVATSCGLMILFEVVLQPVNYFVVAKMRKLVPEAKDE